VTGPVAVLGVDIGGTKTALELVSRGAAPRRRVFPTPVTGAQALAALRAQAANLVGGTAVGGVGVSFGGLVGESGLHSMHVPGWEDAGLVEALGADFGAPVRIANDAEAGAIGEHAALAARGERWRTFVYVTISTGIGGAVLLDGVPFRGSRGLSAEVGHMVVADSGLCSCGRVGHLEAQASGLAIARRAVAGYRAEVTARDVAAAAEAGDPRAAAILHDAGTAVGTALANVAQLFDPDVIVVGGGVSQAGAALWDPIRARVREHALSPVPVRRALLGADSALAGAVELAWAAAAAPRPGTEVTGPRADGA
jgi:glucokinase